MVKVFIAGANGFIGYPVAQALTRAGHDVYGLTRSTDVAKKLQENEITPVLGDAKTPEAWIEKVKDADIVIDAVGGDTIMDMLDATLHKVLYKAFHEEARKWREHGPPLTYIFTFGSLAHGNDVNVVYNDFTPVTTGVPMVAGRISEHRLVTDTKTSFIQGVVIRPSLVYGRSASLAGDILFKPASTGLVRWFGGPGARVGTIHQDDLADLYVKVVEKSPILGGVSITASNPESESWDLILSELCKVVGVKDVTYVAPSNVFEEALAPGQKITPTLARDLLGWTPKKRSFGGGMAEYYAAWRASQGKMIVPGSK